jgi:hypothetical protein
MIALLTVIKFIVLYLRMRPFFFLLFLFACLSSLAQDTSHVASEEVSILYRNEAEGGINIHSNGFGITFKRGWHLTGYRKHILDIDFVSMRDPKQYKLANQFYPDSKPFFFGKLNFAYILRGGYGRQNIIFGKGERSGVEVRYNYYVGLSLGITKPVFLDVLVDNPYDSLTKKVETRKYDPNDADQQVQENIYGPGPYFEGLDQLSIYPGGYGKFALSFEYAGWQQKITAIETGVVVDVYPTSLPIMANSKKNYFFFNFYISLIWGGKW